MAEKPRGSYLATHFLLVAWACEGPPRTAAEAAREFHIRYDNALKYMNKMLELGIVRSGAPGKSGPRGGRRAIKFVPVRVLGGGE